MNAEQGNSRGFINTAQIKCYVGKNPGGYQVACDQTVMSGAAALSLNGNQVVFGPATWDQCQQWIREHQG